MLLLSVPFLLLSLLLATPVHEFGHVLCFRLLGYRGPLRVVWLDMRAVFSVFSIGRGSATLGYVQAPRRIHIYQIFAKDISFAAFLIGISGGAFAACVFASGAWLAVSICNSWIGNPIFAACAATCASQFTYGVREGIFSRRCQDAKNLASYQPTAQTSV